ncbi:hypothetical protein AMTR_s00013p00254640 [Amborella trichopoda]|uniref:Uncharacterized protein n=1 Tax=Amborella trichopoda TaxID=13333 RepID=W1PPR4_AMBTC|nr:hypothetical protein AMTR_s00013p00254640 [Amborella trichopoda]
MYLALNSTIAVQPLAEHQTAHLLISIFKASLAYSIHQIHRAEHEWHLGDHMLAIAIAQRLSLPSRSFTEGGYHYTGKGVRRFSQGSSLDLCCAKVSTKTQLRRTTYLLSEGEVLAVLKTMVNRQ